MSGVASAEGQDLAESLSKMDKNVYQPVPAPEFIPADFGDASRLLHHVNVTLMTTFNGEDPTIFDQLPFPECQPHLLAFERTLPQLQEMIELGGFKIKKIHTTR